MTFNRALLVTALLAICGPMLLFLAILSGGDPLDGFAGGPTYNTRQENILLYLSLYVIPASLLFSLTFAALVAAKNYKTHRKYLFLPLTPIVIFVVMGVATWFAGLYATPYRFHRQLEEQQNDYHYDDSIN